MEAYDVQGDTYEIQELGVDEGPRNVSLPSSAADGKELFDPYPDGEGTVQVEMDQSVNTELYAIGGDGNPIHYDPDFVQIYDEEMLFFDGFPEDALIVQGSAFIYEAVKNSNEVVGHISSRFDKPVDTADEVLINREITDGGEVIKVYLDDIGVQEDDPASTHELTYDAEKLGADEEDVRRLNAANAEKIPKAVGADNQVNNLLMGVKAELGVGYGDDAIDHTKQEGVERGPINREDEFRYEDDTTVTLALLEPHKNDQEDVLKRWDPDRPGETEEYATAMGLMLKTQQQMFEAQKGMIEAYTDMITTVRETS